MKSQTLITLLLLSLLVAACSSINQESTPFGTESPPSDGQSPYPRPINQITSEIIPWYPAPGTPGAPAAGMIMTSGYEPTYEDNNLTRGDVHLELASSQLFIMESYPIQVIAILRGNLPDPCHRLRVTVTAADANNRINLQVYSLTSSDSICAMVLEPFTANIPLGTYAGGHFSVYVNGELLGEFDS